MSIPENLRKLELSFATPYSSLQRELTNGFTERGFLLADKAPMSIRINAADVSQQAAEMIASAPLQHSLVHYTLRYTIIDHRCHQQAHRVLQRSQLFTQNASQLLAERYEYQDLVSYLQQQIISALLIDYVHIAATLCQT